MATNKKQLLYNANDSTTGRDGGPYRDLEEAKYYEKQRALVEDREPDLENPPAHAGIQLNTAQQQLATESVNNLPSQRDTGPVAEVAVKSLVDDDENLLQPFSERDLGVFDEPAPDEPVEDETPKPQPPKKDAPVFRTDAEKEKK